MNRSFFTTSWVPSCPRPILLLVNLFLLSISGVSHAFTFQILHMPPHLQWMGWFDQTPEEEGLANFSRNEDLNFVNENARRGIENLVEIRHVVSEEYTENGAWAGWRLRSDWETSWRAFKNLVEPMVDQGVIMGFAIGDEPVWTGLTVAEVQLVAQRIRQDFPDVKLVVIEAQSPFTAGVNAFGDPVNYDPLPADVDWFGFNNYFNATSTIRSQYETVLYPLLGPGQEAILLPGAFGTRARAADITFNQLDAHQATIANQYFSWAMEDENIVAIMPWRWEDSLQPTPGLFWEVGPKNMPLTGAIWRRNAARVVRSYPRTPKETVPLIQNFDNFSDGEPLPSIYEVNPFAPTGMPTNRVAFSTEQAASGTTSIKVKGLTGNVFRYAWGSNDRNMSRARQTDGYPVQYIEFKVNITNLSALNLEIQALRGVTTVALFRIVQGTGLQVRGSDNVWRTISGISAFNQGWNTVRLKVDMGTIETDGNESASARVNGVEFPAVAFPVRPPTPAYLVYDSLGFEYFKSGPVQGQTRGFHLHPEAKGNGIFNIEQGLMNAYTIGWDPTYQNRGHVLIVEAPTRTFANVNLGWEGFEGATESVYTHVLFEFYNEDINQAVISTRRGSTDMAKIWLEDADAFRVTARVNDPAASVSTLNNLSPMYPMNTWNTFRLTTRWDPPFDSATPAEFSVYINGQRMDVSDQNNLFYNAGTSLAAGELDLIHFNIWTPATRSIFIDDLRVESSTNPAPQSTRTTAKVFKTFNTVMFRTWNTTPLFLDDIGIWGDLESKP